MNNVKLFQDLMKVLHENNLDSTLGSNKEIEFKFDGADLGFTN
ncbi:hypothetical protein P8855_01920 [Bacillus inaquosorum]|nr:hypothetical protein [Bacillus inaquosorum]